MAVARGSPPAVARPCRGSFLQTLLARLFKCSCCVFGCVAGAELSVDCKPLSRLGPCWPALRAPQLADTHERPWQASRKPLHIPNLNIFNSPPFALRQRTAAEHLATPSAADAVGACSTPWPSLWVPYGALLKI